MGLGLGLGAAAILWVADQLSLDRQRAQLEGLVGLSADRTAEIIHRAAHDGMLRNDADGVRRDHREHRRPGGRRLASASTTRRGASGCPPARDEEGTLVDKHSDECIACHAGPQPKAGLERARPDPDAPRGGRRPRPRHHHPDLQRGEVHRLPRAPRVAARARASSTCGSRWRRPTRPSRASERQMQYGLFATGLAVLLLSFLLLWALVLRPVKRLRARHRARRRGRPLGAGAGTHAGRDGRARPLVERDDRRPAARAGGPRGPQPHARSSASRRRRASSSSTHHQMVVVEKMASLGQARRGGGPRDQQPARRHPHLRAAAAAPAEGVGRRPAARRAGQGDRPHPRDGRRRGRPLRRHRAQPARVQPAVGRPLRRGGPRRRSSSAAGCC